LRRRFAVLLLLCLCLPVAGTLALLQNQRYAVRKSVKKKLVEGVRDSELVQLSFRFPQDAHLLQWQDEHEFAFEGNLYDIVRVRTEGDSVHYGCWLDSEETQLYQRLEALFDQVWPTAPQPTRTKERLLEFWKKLFYSPVRDLASAPLPRVARRPLASADEAWLFDNGPVMPPAPPPENIGRSPC
jgi:hypothetical protein